MATLEQKYYEMLARTDHPVFARDLSATTTGSSPFNSILNRLMARQLVTFRAELENVRLNAFPDTCNADGIDKWEETYFGFTKATLDLPSRIAELLLKINRKFRMTVGDVIFAAQAITGQAPTVVRSLYFGGWVLDQSVLDISTILGGGNQGSDAQTYIVTFANPVDSYLLAKLDSELTKIEKGGSKHFIIAPPRFWVLDRNTLDVDTILG